MHPTQLAPNPRPSRFRRGKAAGFTLTEILIAIALIVALVALAVANLGAILGGGQTQVAQTFVTTGIDTPLLAYKLATGSYPTTEQGLMALIQQPQGVTNWAGPYLNKSTVPTDPWGSPYQYQYPAQKNTLPGSYDCWSIGPDKQPGTADDIGNWQR